MFMRKDIQDGQLSVYLPPLPPLPCTMFSPCLNISHSPFIPCLETFCKCLGGFADCPVCIQEPKVPMDKVLQGHKRKHDQMTCDKCYRSCTCSPFIYEPTSSNDDRTYIPTPASKKPRPSLRQGNGKFVCHVCEIRLKKKQHLSLHVATKHPLFMICQMKYKAFGCPGCRKGFDNRHQVQEHIMSGEHPASALCSKPKFVCYRCFKHSMKEGNHTCTASHEGDGSDRCPFKRIGKDGKHTNVTCKYIYKRRDVHTDRPIGLPCMEDKEHFMKHLRPMITRDRIGIVIELGV